METILSGLLGIMVGGVIVGIYSFRKNSALYTKVLDKQTIIKLIKEHLDSQEKSKPKPRKNYRRKPRTSNAVKTTKSVV